MKSEEAIRIGASFYAQTAAWFLITALLSFATRGTNVASTGGEAYAGLVTLATFALATLLVLLLAKVKMFMRVYSWLVYFSLLYGVYFVFALLWPIPAALIMVPVAASLLFFSPRVLSQNLVLAIALAGVACQFASFVSFPVALALIIILSLYDIVAVNVTHHMVAMAKSVIKVHLPVVFVMPWKAQDLSEHVQRFEPGSSAVFLGAGDIAFPAILVATAPTTTTSVAITLGALAGFFILTVSFLGGKKQHPLPALPFLTVSILIALGLSLLV